MNTYVASILIKTALIALIVLSFVFAEAKAGATNDSPALERLKQQFAQEVMFRAELSHFFTDSFSGETSETYGTIWFSRDRYRIETPDQVIVVNGDVSTVLNIRQNRLIISHYDAEEDEFAPSRFFASDNEAYTSIDQSNADGSTTITITSDDPFEMFQRVQIRVSREGNPMQIDALDQMENTIRTTFRFGRFSPTDGVRFTLLPPPGAEIVDLRD
jgi:outer membrane lipoprotein-sorting protein